MHVVVHNAVSVDGRIEGFEPDVGTYYELARTWDVDAHLVGADTLIDGMAREDQAVEDGGREAGAPLLVVPDSRARVSDWAAVVEQPFWSSVLVLCSTTTPETAIAALHDEGIDTLVVGDDHVDYEGALARLEADFGVETVLVDSGGTLSGHLFAAGLVDELSLLVHPVLVGETGARSFLRGPARFDGPIPLDNPTIEHLDGGRLWVRYRLTDGITGGNH